MFSPLPTFHWWQINSPRQKCHKFPNTLSVPVFCGGCRWCICVYFTCLSLFDSALLSLFTTFRGKLLSLSNVHVGGNEVAKEYLQQIQNCRDICGTLRSWGHLSFLYYMAKTGPMLSIFLLKQISLSFLDVLNANLSEIEILKPHL